MLLRRLAPVLLATLALGVSCTPAPATSPPAWDLDMLGQVNAQRSANGVGPLTVCPLLAIDAQRHSNDQASHHKMTHTGSDGSDMATRAARVGYNHWSGLAENVAMGQASVSTVMGSWMSSAGHRTNLLNPAYNHVGFGLAYDGRTPYWTQDFGANGTC